tara:strand:+ start:409 stop:525 length:117 start_codon:yes stop_codon:yes gene_type:complete
MGTPFADLNWKGYLMRRIVYLVGIAVIVLAALRIAGMI